MTRATRSIAGHCLRHFSVDRVEIEFRGVDEADRGWTDGADLPHDFRANRSAGASHQHATAGDEAMHGLGIEHDLRPPEQVLDRDRLQFGRVRGAGPEPGRVRPPRHRQAQPVCALDQGIEPRRRQCSIDHDELAGPVARVPEFRDHPLHVGDPAEDRHAAQKIVHAVIEHADGIVLGGTIQAEE